MTMTWFHDDIQCQAEHLHFPSRSKEGLGVNTQGFKEGYETPKPGAMASTSSQHRQVSTTSLNPHDSNLTPEYLCRGCHGTTGDSKPKLLMHPALCS